MWQETFHECIRYQIMEKKESWEGAQVANDKPASEKKSLPIRDDAPDSEEDNLDDLDGAISWLTPKA